MLRDTQLRNAREEDVRRLCRFVGIEGWDVAPKLVLIDELCWKGVAVAARPFAWSMY